MDLASKHLASVRGSLAKEYALATVIDRESHRKKRSHMPSIPGFQPNVFPIPDNEEERMKVLRSLDILDTAAEAAFDHITDWGRRGI